MTPTVNDCIRQLETWAPAHSQQTWDNSGLQLGNLRHPVRRILVALDCTLAVAQEAVQLGADLIVTHHPLLFKGIRQLNTSCYPANIIQLLLSHDISLYSMHTNLDIAPAGVNETLADHLGLLPDGRETDLFYLRGSVSPQTGEQFLTAAAQALQISRAQIYGVLPAEIRTVGICCGAGGDLFTDLPIHLQADLYVTGEVKYHDGLALAQNNVCVVAFGHYATQKPIVKNICGHLQSWANEVKYNLDIMIVHAECDPCRHWIIGG